MFAARSPSPLGDERVHEEEDCCGKEDCASHRDPRANRSLAFLTNGYVDEESATLRQHAGAHHERRSDFGGVGEGCLADENIVKKRHQQENARMRMTGSKCRNFEWWHAVIAIDDAKQRIATVHNKW
jgi:hypothetical protein